MQQIERRGELSYQEYLSEYGIPGKPVILTQATQGWRALQWTPENLVERVGDKMVETTPSASLEEATVKMTLAEYVDYLKSPDDRLLYMTSWNFRDICPELLDDFEIPIYFREDWLSEIPEEEQFDLLWLFLGPDGAGFRLHVDVGLTSAWNVQLTGRKKWIFFPPEQAHLLYEGEVDAFDPDLEQYPDFAQTAPLEATLGPGEMVFTPSGWWHQTKNIEGGLAITGNFANQTNYAQVQEWLDEVGIHLDLGQDMKSYAKHFRRVVAGHVEAL